MSVLEVFSLVTAAIFGWIAVILFIFRIIHRIMDAVRDYARAVRAIQRIAPIIDRNVVDFRRSD